jgi:hypothetical protein
LHSLPMPPQKSVVLAFTLVQSIRDDLSVLTSGDEKVRKGRMDESRFNFAF